MTTRQTKKALLIGINYTGTDSQLNGCINDVLSVQTFLVAYAQYSPSEITLLTDTTAVKPTRAAMERAMQALVANAQSGDTLVLHYSGHGSQTRDSSKDETDGVDEVLVPLDYATAGMITDDWVFENVMKKVPTGATLQVFMDCCHSGTICDLRHNFKSTCRLKTGKLRVGMPFVYTDWTEQYTLSRERSTELAGTVCMFSGALDREYAEDAWIANKAQGAFTYCLLETLRANLVALQNGTLRLRNLLKEINGRLDVGGYANQQCQLSVTARAMFEQPLRL